MRAVASAMGLRGLLWNFDTNDFRLAGNVSAFDAQGGLTAIMTEQAKLSSIGAVGVITLQHDLYPETVSEAIKALPAAGKIVPLMSAAECIGDLTPYEDKSIRIPASNAAVAGPKLIANGTGNAKAGTSSSAGRTFTAISLYISTVALAAILYQNMG